MRKHIQDSMYYFILFVIFCMVFAFVSMIGCGTITVPQQPYERIALYWENTTSPHPERKAWSDEVVRLFKKDLDTFSKASDVSYFCPMFNSLNEAGKLKALGELWVAVSYFESGFDPKNASVDVGTKSNKDTWSVGLYQMSVVDQKNYGLSFGYTYDDLIKPLPNINLAMAVLKSQVIKRGVLAVLRPNPGVYWSVLRDKTELIKVRMLSNATGCI